MCSTGSFISGTLRNVVLLPLLGGPFMPAGTSGRFELKERFMPIGSGGRGGGRGGGNYGGGRGGGGSGGYSLMLGGDDEEPGRAPPQVRARMGICMNALFSPSLQNSALCRSHAPCCPLDS